MAPRESEVEKSEYRPSEIEREVEPQKPRDNYTHSPNIERHENYPLEEENPLLSREPSKPVSLR